MRVADAWKITFELQAESRVSRPRRDFPVIERKYKRLYAGVPNRWYNETLGPRPVLDGDFSVFSECPCSERLNIAVKTVVFIMGSGCKIF